MSRRDEIILTELIDKIDKATNSASLMYLLKGLKELDFIKNPKHKEVDDNYDYYGEESKIRSFDLLGDAYYKAAEKINNNEDRFHDLSNFATVYMDTSKFWHKQAADLRIRKLTQNGIELQGQKNHYEAIKTFQEAIDLQPSEIETSNILTYLGKSYMAIRKFEESAKCFNGVLEINPSNPHAWFGMGILQTKSNN